MMSEAAVRPPHGYPLATYDALKRDIRTAQAEIEASRRAIAAHSRSLSGARWMLRSAEHTLAWMRANQAAEIAELEAARAKVRALIRRGRP